MTKRAMVTKRATVIVMRVADKVGNGKGGRGNGNGGKGVRCGKATATKRAMAVSGMGRKWQRRGQWQ